MKRAAKTPIYSTNNNVNKVIKETETYNLTPRKRIEALQQKTKDNTQFIKEFNKRKGSVGLAKIDNSIKNSFNIEL